MGDRCSPVSAFPRGKNELDRGRRLRVIITCRTPAEEAPCKQACPAGIDIPRYVRLIGKGKFGEALAVIREKIPFPAVCGRVCFRPCEVNCHLNEVNGSVDINALKRFVAERGNGLWKERMKVAEPTGNQVAIVGSGPAGLTAAYYLAKLGHGVTLFEAQSQPGGMMRVGIPEYRLPRQLLIAEIEEIKNVGVEIITNTKVESLEGLFQEGYDAVFLAIGASRGLRIGVPGEDESGAIDGISLLRDVNLGKEVKMGKRVVVIGGGNTAIDASRVSLRLGAEEVTVLYRRSREEMPASTEEVKQALEEGVKMMFLAVPSRLSRNNNGVIVECQRMNLGEPDVSGRGQPLPISGSEFRIEVDAVIAAIGQTPEAPSQFGLVTSPEGRLHVDPSTMVTDRTGVFAGGDAVTGPASVIEAIAAGRKAAVSIDKYLGGAGIIDESLVSAKQEARFPMRGVPIGERVEMPMLPVGQRLHSFAEVELGVGEEAAVSEARRCLWCDLPIIADPTKCTACRICQWRCSLRFAIGFNSAEARIKVHRLVTPDLKYSISFTDECDACGICARYCPYEALDRTLGCGKEER